VSIPHATAITDTEFAAWMAPLGPFEPAPALAVAVSGGPDSLALTLLLDAWTRARGGSLLALTVDHGLRPEAAGEAAWVAERLAGRGIAHRTLRWHPPDPARVRQAEARDARYALLTDAATQAGILYLALGHHREDQAETVLLRARAGSGPAGLAGMAPLRYLGTLSLIRPLLAVGKARLEATLRAQGETWITDPSNADPAHARVRVRRALPALAEAGVTVERLCTLAALMGRARNHVEAATAEVLARAASLDPAGHARLDPAPILAAPAPVATSALGQTLACVGGRTHLPRSARLAHLLDSLRDAPQRARTLGGCRIVPRRGVWLLVREAGRAPEMALTPGETATYDGRFAVEVAPSAPADLRVGPLGAAGWAALAAHAPHLRRSAIPPPARPALPALRDSRGLRAVPALGWRREDAAPGAAIRLVPRRALTGIGFTVAPRPRHTISLVSSGHGPGPAGRGAGDRNTGAPALDEKGTPS